jgi:LPXTG-site transpeptidase (sortase) family protein
MSKKSSKNSGLKRLIAPVAGVLAAILVVFALNAEYLIAQFIYRFGDHTSNTNSAVVQAKSAEKPEEPKQVAPEPKVIIPGIGVDAPVVFGMTSTVERDVQRALQDGVVHYANTAQPGQPGNGVYVGHSSNAPWVPGRYKFVFTALEHVNVGDTFYIHQNSKQYQYKVVTKKVVNPHDTSVLNSGDKPTATLITCTPVGTSLNRLVIVGEQIHPKPASGAAQKPTTQPSVLPGN